MALTPLLDLAGFKSRALMASGDIDALETAEPGWILQQLVDGTAYIYSRLGKRYKTPFVAPYPVAALRWLAALTDVRAYLKRGVSPSDEQFALVKESAELAQAELKEAADSQAGLFDLPLQDGADSSAIAKGGPLSYSEASPYAFTDVQARAIGNGQ